MNTQTSYKPRAGAHISCTPARQHCSPRAGTSRYKPSSLQGSQTPDNTPGNPHTTGPPQPPAFAASAAMASLQQARRARQFSALPAADQLPPLSSPCSSWLRHRAHSTPAGGVARCFRPRSECCINTPQTRGGPPHDHARRTMPHPPHKPAEIGPPRTADKRVSTPTHP